MKFEFHFRTYCIFGQNTTLVLVGKWLEKQTQPRYGGTISSILIEACCRNTSPPRATLNKLHENFENWVGTLPVYEVAAKRQELRICFNAIRYKHDEIQRDSQVLSVKTFQQMVGKAEHLLRMAPRNINNLYAFDVEKLTDDIVLARAKMPQTLDELIGVYNEFKGI